MPQPQYDQDATPSFQEVAQYVRDMSGELAGMAHGAGMAEVARVLARARELCEAELGDGG